MIRSSVYIQLLISKLLKSSITEVLLKNDFINVLDNLFNKVSVRCCSSVWIDVSVALPVLLQELGFDE